MNPPENWLIRAIKSVLPAALMLACFAAPVTMAAGQLSITSEDAERIGGMIFRNECGGRDECLITWNKGEDFISLGIGHCIWYPKDKIGPFDESFPKLLKFMKENEIALPDWLQWPETPYCPWNSREEFLRDIKSPKADDLKRLLIDTKALQLIFIFDRLKAALPKMLESADETARPNIEKQFRRMSGNPAGIYALTDYVNFSGEGILATERYNGRGWGLMQVLGRMDGSEEGREAICEFVKAAKDTLMERVKNSDPERCEAKWIPGWYKRLDTYVKAFDDLP